MKRLNAKCNMKKVFCLYLLFYFIIHLLFLVDFPFVHGDEPWLSGLSKAMLDYGDVSVTEPFFDLYERNPHAIKTLFHGIQMIFIGVFGYHIFSLRLISLLFSVGCLYFFYGLCRNLFQWDKIALFTTILLSIDIQFIYGSHFARQEIVILFVIILATYILFKNLQHHSYRTDLLIGTILGLGIGIHPNSFMAAVTLGSMYLLLILRKKIQWKNILLLILIVLLFASFFVMASLYMDRDYISNYQQSGESFGTYRGLGEKFLKSKNFYKNIYLGKSVTYYIPNVQLQALLFGLCFILFPILMVKNKKDSESLGIKAMAIGILAIHLGNMAIGRYNVTSILFGFPFMYVLVAYVLTCISPRGSQLLAGCILITLLHTLAHMPSYDSTYGEYVQEISQYVQKEDRVLSNLNTQYYFDGENFFDYRNLQFLKDKKKGFEEYILSRKIQYIIYYEEMDFIYKRTPIYNGVYGDVSSYYPEMKEFLNEKCHRVYSFTNRTYGTNIVRFIDERDWKVHIFKVKAAP